jgi:hypothetical protein
MTAINHRCISLPYALTLRTIYPGFWNRNITKQPSLSVQPAPRFPPELSERRTPTAIGSPLQGNSDPSPSRPEVPGCVTSCPTIVQKSGGFLAERPPSAPNPLRVPSKPTRRRPLLKPLDETPIPRPPPGTEPAVPPGRQVQKSDGFSAERQVPGISVRRSWPPRGLTWLPAWGA